MHLLVIGFGYDDDATIERDLLEPGDTIEYFRRGQAKLLTEQSRAEADAVILYSSVERLADPPESFPRCRIAIRSGVGFDNLDVAGWGKQGVPVCNVPDYGTSEVADHAIALMLALTRGTGTYQELLRADPVGGWRFAAAPLARRLRGNTFGVLGLGRIGTAAAMRARGFGMRVLFFDPYLSSGAELAVGFDRAASLDQLIAESAVLSIHTPLSEETEGLIGREALAHADASLILINTARGPIVDLDALHDALHEGRIAGAGLDVLPHEPAKPDHPLIRAWTSREPWLDGRLVLSPHAAFYSPEGIDDLRRKTIEVALDWLRHGKLRNCVNPAMLAEPATPRR
jgi:D-3-phosphoglycerate dehydrogenase/C-terminal binding protein